MGEATTCTEVQVWFTNKQCIRYYSRSGHAEPMSEPEAAFRLASCTAWWNYRNGTIIFSRDVEVYISLYRSMCAIFKLSVIWLPSVAHKHQTMMVVKSQWRTYTSCTTRLLLAAYSLSVCKSLETKPKKSLSFLLTAIFVCLPSACSAYSALNGIISWDKYL